MRTDDLWLMRVILYLGLPWLIAYLSSGSTSVTRLVTLKKQIPKPLTPRAEEDCPYCQTDRP